MVASRVQKSYGYTSEQIEACVLANHSALSRDAKCAGDSRHRDHNDESPISVRNYWH